MGDTGAERTEPHAYPVGARLAHRQQVRAIFMVTSDDRRLRSVPLSPEKMFVQKKSK